MEATAGPLSGVRVVDLTHVLNGPFCTMLLAHMGADVVKIEHGEGDRFRHSWLPVGADHDSYEFMVVNANKRAITLNLKTDRGKELFRDLVKQADVVVENFSVGVMDRLGLGYEDLKKVNPKIIYGCSRGYGEDGPYANVRANAGTINAMSGWTAAAWEFSGVPGKKPQGIGDEAAGVSMALGILAALYSRDHGGGGQKIEVPMIEAVMGFMVGNFHTFFEHRRVGTPSKQCADGWVAFHLPDMTDELWERFTTEIGHLEGQTDPRFSSRKARRENMEELEEVVSTWVRSSTRAELWQIFQHMGISAAPIREIAEVLEDEHIRVRGTFVSVNDKRSGPLTLLRPWVLFSETPTSIDHAGPAVGEHNREVYSELLGLSMDEIDRLEQEGVIS